MSLTVFMALKEAWCPVQRRHLETARQGMHWTLLSCCGSDPTLEETPMKSITRLVTAVVAVLFAVATLCHAQDVKPTDLGKGAAFHGKKIEMKDKGEVAYLLSFTAGKEFEATHGGREENRGENFGA